MIANHVERKRGQCASLSDMPRVCFRRSAMQISFHREHQTTTATAEKPTPFIRTMRKSTRRGTDRWPMSSRFDVGVGGSIRVESYEAPAPAWRFFSPLFVFFWGLRNKKANNMYNI